MRFSSGVDLSRHFSLPDVAARPVVRLAARTARLLLNTDQEIP
jgi:hypothetical protein